MWSMDDWHITPRTAEPDGAYLTNTRTYQQHQYQPPTVGEDLSPNRVHPNQFFTFTHGSTQPPFNQRSNVDDGSEDDLSDTHSEGSEDEEGGEDEMNHKRRLLNHTLLASTSVAQTRVTDPSVAAARRLRTAMQNTTAALRKELATHADQLPPPLPLMQSSKKEFVSRLPKTGFGADAVPCCRAPHHIIGHAPASEPLVTTMTPEHRALLIAKLKQYDQERNDPNVPLSPLFLNRMIYDCTASPTFSKRWIVGKILGADGQVTRCTCMNCVMYGQSSASLNGSHSRASLNLDSSSSFISSIANTSTVAHSPSSSTLPAPTSTCNGDWLVEVRSYYTPTSPEDTTLVFESRFESGNLRTAFQVSEQEYDLTVRPDFNTTHHTQWYYFSVRNTRKNKVYKFNLINFVKPASLYNEGMQPLIYSTVDANSKDGVKKGWYRGGNNICYYQNHIPRGSSRQKFYYTLSFTVEFPHENDTVYFAYAYPYTYTNLNRDLHLIELDPTRSRFVRRRTLCKTLAGNDCDMLTITNFDSTADEMKERKGIVYTARVHPGESNSSWIMRGCIDFLTSSDPIAAALRNLFIFKLVPMLNVDGVVNGNYRCSLAGVDLNRHWKDPSATIHPTIHATKLMIKRMAAVRPILMCIDLHGHSRKFNIFIYGCPNITPIPIAPVIGEHKKKKKEKAAARAREQRELQAAQIALTSPTRFMERVFPKLLAEPLTPADMALTTEGGTNNLTSPASSKPTSFSLKDCTFSISRGKESTARVVLWREIGLMNSFTLEASFAGASIGQLKGLQFNSSNFETMGKSMVETLWRYINPTLHEQARLAVCDQMSQLSATELERGEDDSDDSSDSPDEVGLPLTAERATAAAKRKKKKTKLSKAAAAAAATAETFNRLATPSSTSATRRSSMIDSSTKDPTKGVWSETRDHASMDETIAKAKKHRQAILSKKRQQEATIAALSAPREQTTASPPTVALTPIPSYYASGMGISGYYRTIPPPPLRAANSGSNITVAMILSEEEERARLFGLSSSAGTSDNGSPRQSHLQTHSSTPDYQSLDDSPAPSATTAATILNRHTRTNSSIPAWEAGSVSSARGSSVRTHHRSGSGSISGFGSSRSIPPKAVRPKSAYPVGRAETISLAPTTLLIDTTTARNWTPSTSAVLDWNQKPNEKPQMTMESFMALGIASSQLQGLPSYPTAQSPTLHHLSHPNPPPALSNHPLKSHRPLPRPSSSIASSNTTPPVNIASVAASAAASFLLQANSMSSTSTTTTSITSVYRPSIPSDPLLTRDADALNRRHMDYLNSSTNGILHHESKQQSPPTIDMEKNVARTTITKKPASTVSKYSTTASGRSNLIQHQRPSAAASLSISQLGDSLMVAGLGSSNEPPMRQERSGSPVATASPTYPRRPPPRRTSINTTTSSVRVKYPSSSPSSSPIASSFSDGATPNSNPSSSPGRSGYSSRPTIQLSPSTTTFNSHSRVGPSTNANSYGQTRSKPSF